MSYDPRFSFNGAAAGAGAISMDEALRGHMLRVYQQMMIGLAICFGIAITVSSVPALFALMRSPLGFVVMLAPLAILFFGLSPQRVQRMSPASVAGLYYLVAGLIGASMSAIFVKFTGGSIAQVFFITAAMFGATSLYGYTTKKDLSGFGQFLFMGLIGLLIVMLVNLVLGLFGVVIPMMHTIISIVGVLIFAGFTAYDTQRIKEMYAYGAGSQDDNLKLAALGALSLFLNFINIFQFLMSLMGQSDD